MEFQSNRRMNNCLAYSNYSYSGIGPQKRTISLIHVCSVNQNWIIYIIITN